MPVGESAVMSLQDSKQRLSILLIIQVSVSSILMKCLDELSNYAPARSHARQREIHQTATKLWSLITTIENHIAGSLGQDRNGKIMGQQITKREFFREAVWNTWKKFGCPAKPFEGASVAITEMAALRKADSKSRPAKVQQLLIERTCLNTPVESITSTVPKISSFKNILQLSQEPTVPEALWEESTPLPQSKPLSERPILEFESVLQEGDLFRTVNRFPTTAKKTEVGGD